MGIPGVDFGLYIGVHFGGIFGCFWGPLEVVLYGTLHIDNSIAFPISI